MDNILDIVNLTVKIKDRDTGSFYAVKDLNLGLKKGSALGIVGESGSGKSVTALAIMGLSSRDSYIESGEIIFDGLNIIGLSRKGLNKLRGNEMSMIFQDPMSSLNPLIKTGRQVEESLRLHTDLSKTQIRERALEAMQYAGLTNAGDIYNTYPHQLSGGMRQRVMIAAAVASKPKLILADEPTTALDSTTQAQIIELFVKMKNEHSMSILFISHNFRVISKISDYIGVMYMGHLMEYGKSCDITLNPGHPYTRALIKCIPSPDLRGKKLYAIKASADSAPETGCAFAPRCDYANAKCFSGDIPMARDGGRMVKCIRYGEI